MRRRPMLLPGISIVLILFIVHCSPLPLKLTSPDLRAAMEMYSAPEHAAICGVLEAKRGEGDFAVLILKEVTLERGENVLSIGKVRVRPSDPSICEDVSLGWILKAEGKLSVIEGPQNPGEFDRAAYYRIQGISFQMKEAELSALKKSTDPITDTLDRWRTQVKMRIRDLFPGDVSGLIQGMLVGDRSEIETDTKTWWQAGGVTHMLAISGLHLSLIGMGIFYLLRFLRIPLVPSGVIASAILLLYTFFVGCPISAVRAVLMFLVMMGAKLSGRTYDPVTALAAAAVFVLITNPEYLLYSAFQMSCCAVLLTTVFRKRSKFALALLLYLWMLPLVAWSYFEIPLLSIPVNLLVVPLLPFILGGGILSLAGGFLTAGFPLLSPLGNILQILFRSGTTAVLRGINQLLIRVNQLPFSVYPSGRPGTWQLLLYLAMLFFWTWFFEKWRLFLRRFLLLPFVPLLIFILGFHPRKLLTVTFLSVGQGDGIVIEMPSGHTVLVDGGSTSKDQVGRYTLAPFLKYEGHRRIDYVVATHMDQDHISGIKELLTMAAAGNEHLEIGALLLPKLKEESEAYSAMENLAFNAGVRVIHIEAGDSFQIGEAVFEILGPDFDTEALPINTNAECTVLSLKYRDFDALFTGDVEGEGEEALIRRLRTKRGRSGAASLNYELLKVAHHGSSSSTSKELLDLLQPSVSVISCGVRNRYGHPHKELLERLDSSGTAVFRTDLSGAVTVSTDGQKLTVKTYR